jgi:hypothetical protein
MWPAFPASDYYGGSATSRPAEPTTSRPAGDLDGRPTGPARDASHVHHTPVDGVGAQLCPCGFATSTPQTFLVASLPATSPGTEVARPVLGAGAHRTPAHIHQIGAGVPLERLYTLVPHVHLPVSLGRPRSSGSTDQSRRCQGCSHLHRRLPARAALSFPNLLRQTGDGVPSPPSGNAAPRGARRARCRRSIGPRRSCRSCRPRRRG